MVVQLRTVCKFKTRETPWALPKMLRPGVTAEVWVSDLARHAKAFNTCRTHSKQVGRLVVASSDQFHFPDTASCHVDEKTRSEGRLEEATKVMSA